MKSLENYVEARLNYESAENDLINEICEILSVDRHKIKNLWMRSSYHSTVIQQIVTIEFRGVVRLSSDDISKLGNCRVILPNEIEIEVGEIHL